jgi:hypothetical protein
MWNIEKMWKYINRSQKHECGIGAEAVQFLFWECINGIYVAVHLDIRLTGDFLHKTL